MRYWIVVGATVNRGWCHCYKICAVTLVRHWRWLYKIGFHLGDWSCSKGGAGCTLGCGCFAWVIFKDLTLCAIDLSFTVQTTCLVWDRPGIIICEVSTLVLLLMLCGARGGNYRLGGYPTRRRILSEWDRVEMDHCKSLVVISLSWG